MPPPKLRAILCCFAQLSLLSGMEPQEPDPTSGALIVEAQNLDLEGGFFEFRLVNNAQQPVTALAYDLVVLLRDGSRRKNTSYFETIYSAHLPAPSEVPPLHPRSGPVWPGQAAPFRDKMPGKPGTEVLLAYVEPRAVVMMDRTAIGDDERIKTIGEERQAFFAALETWLPTFERTLSNARDGADPAAELKALVRAVEKAAPYRPSLNPGQRSIARMYERKLADHAKRILATAEGAGEESIKQRLARRVETYRAQLIACQDSWKLIASEGDGR